MKEKKLKKQIASGIILILVGLFFLLGDFISEKREKVFSAMNLELSELLANEVTASEEPDDPNANVDAPVEQPPVVNSGDYETYAGILEIPKIGFEKGFYRIGSSLNNVKFNIKILDTSSYPDEENGNVIIIGHSGNYSNSYFGNLYQLQIGDIARLQYEGNVYQYKIVNVYTDTKDGTVTIYRDETKSILTLITCTKDDETTQTIYIFELENME